MVPYAKRIENMAFTAEVVKGLFGGLGKNFLNPALAARAFLTTFPALMSSWTELDGGFDLLRSVDAVTFPDRSPLAMGENGTTPIPFSMQNGMISRSRSRSTME